MVYYIRDMKDLYVLELYNQEKNIMVGQDQFDSSAEDVASNITQILGNMGNQKYRMKLTSANSTYYGTTNGGGKFQLYDSAKMMLGGGGVGDAYVLEIHNGSEVMDQRFVTDNVKQKIESIVDASCDPNTKYRLKLRSPDTIYEGDCYKNKFKLSDIRNGYDFSIYDDKTNDLIVSQKFQSDDIGRTIDTMVRTSCDPNTKYRLKLRSPDTIYEGGCYKNKFKLSDVRNVVEPHTRERSTEVMRGGYDKTKAFSKMAADKMNKTYNDTQESVQHAKFKKIVKDGTEGAVNGLFSSMNSHVGTQPRPTQQIMLNHNHQIMPTDNHAANPFGTQFKNSYNNDVMFLRPQLHTAVGEASVDMIVESKPIHPLNVAVMSSRNYYYEVVRRHLLAENHFMDFGKIVGINTTGDPRECVLLRKWAVTDKMLKSYFLEIEGGVGNDILVFPGAAPAKMMSHIKPADKHSNCFLRYYPISDPGLAAKLGLSLGYHNIMKRKITNDEFAKKGSVEIPNIDKEITKAIEDLTKPNTETVPKCIGDLEFYSKCRELRLQNLPIAYAHFTTKDASIPYLLDEMNSLKKFDSIQNPYQYLFERYGSTMSNEKPAIITITEASTEVARWMSFKHRIDQNRNLIRENIFHTEEEWIGLLLQWGAALTVLEHNHLHLQLDETCIRVQPTQVGGHWTYRINGAHHFVPTQGSLGIIDISMRSKHHLDLCKCAKNQMRPEDYQAELNSIEFEIMEISGLLENKDDEATLDELVGYLDALRSDKDTSDKISKLDKKLAKPISPTRDLKCLVMLNKWKRIVESTDKVDTVEAKVNALCEAVLSDDTDVKAFCEAVLRDDTDVKAFCEAVLRDSSDDVKALCELLKKIKSKDDINLLYTFNLPDTTTIHNRLHDVYHNLKKLSEDMPKSTEDRDTRNQMLELFKIINTTTPKSMNSGGILGNNINSISPFPDSISEVLTYYIEKWTKTPTTPTTTPTTPTTTTTQEAFNEFLTNPLVLRHTMHTMVGSTVDNGKKLRFANGGSIDWKLLEHKLMLKKSTERWVYIYKIGDSVVTYVEKNEEDGEYVVRRLPMGQFTNEFYDSATNASKPQKSRFGTFGKIISLGESSHGDPIMVKFT